MTLRLSASNIAWEPVDDAAVAGVLRANGFAGIEIAPTKRWESPVEATKKEVASYRAEWEKRGLRIVAMQSLLFGRPDLQLFGSVTVRRALREYLIALIEMAHGLGAQTLVFGSPKNRKRGKMPLAEANEIACEFFRELGAVAASRGCWICIEPNPVEYDCDFVNTTAEAVALVELIRSRGVKVNGDLGAMRMAGDEPVATIGAAAGWLGHFHVSEPFLEEPSGDESHEAAADALRRCEYDGWVSIEMRAAGAAAVQTMARVASRVRAAYTAPQR